MVQYTASPSGNIQYISGNIPPVQGQDGEAEGRKAISMFNSRFNSVLWRINVQNEYKARLSYATLVEKKIRNLGRAVSSANNVTFNGDLVPESAAIVNNERRNG